MCVFGTLSMQLLMRKLWKLQGNLKFEQITANLHWTVS